MHNSWHHRFSLAVPARRLTLIAGLLILAAGTGSVMAQPPTIPQFPPDNPTTDTTTAPRPVKPAMAKPAKATPAPKATKAAPPKKTKGDKKNDAKVPTGPKHVVLVFPVDAKGTGEQLSDIVTDVIKSRLSLSGKYSGITYVTSIPAIRRSVSDQSLSQSEVQPPFTSRTKVQKLTTTAGYDMAIVSSLDQYEYNADNQNVSIVLSITMTDFTGSTPKNYTAAETVTTAPKSAKSATDTTAAEAAVRSLAEKIVVSVLNSATGGTAK